MAGKGIRSMVTSATYNWQPIDDVPRRVYRILGGFAGHGDDTPPLVLYWAKEDQAWASKDGVIMLPTHFCTAPNNPRKDDLDA